jgi:WD40 repeat protein
VVAWDAATGERLNEAGYGSAAEPIAAKPRPVSEIQVSPDGGTVFAALMPSYTPDEPIALVAPLSGSGVGSAEEMPMPEGWEAESVVSAAFDSDGRNIVLGTETGRVARADTRNGALAWDVENQHEGPAQEILVAGDGQSILSMGGDNKIAVLDAADGTEIHRVATVSKPLAAVLGSDGKQLIVASEDQGVVTVQLDDADLVDLVESKIIYRGECDAGC